MNSVLDGEVVSLGWMAAAAPPAAPYSESVHRFRLLRALAVAAVAFAQTTHEENNPFPAYRIMDNLYYVGTDDITSYLIVTPRHAQG
jgi:hypothetical protein